MKPVIKNYENVVIKKFGALSMVSVIMLTAFAGCTSYDKVPLEDIKIEDKMEDNQAKPQPQNVTKSTKARELEQLRKVKFKTYEDTYLENGKKRIYTYAKEEDILNYGREMGVALEGYYMEDCGAGYWTNSENEQFWPEDIEYIITAIALQESSYRCNAMNSLGCGGLTGLKKDEVMATLKNQWFTTNIWDNSVPNVSCDPKIDDIFNPATCIEYTYHFMGYEMANRFKKDKKFIYNGEKRSVWEVLEYSAETQNRLLIASHMYGMNSVVKAVFGDMVDKNGNKIHINDYLYSDYVESVLSKTKTLQSKYKDVEYTR